MDKLKKILGGILMLPFILVIVAIIGFLWIQILAFIGVIVLVISIILLFNIGIDLISGKL